VAGLCPGHFLFLDWKQDGMAGTIQTVLTAAACFPMPRFSLSARCRAQLQEASRAQGADRLIAGRLLARCCPQTGHVDTPNRLATLLIENELPPSTVLGAHFAQQASHAPIQDQT
jgi:hypothetical protein